MFFTVERIDSVVIELDSFYKYPGYLREILTHTAHLKRAFVQTQDDKRWEVFKVSSEQVYCAQTEVEIGIFQNLIRRALIGEKFDRNCTLFITMSNAQLRAGQELLLATILLVPPGTARVDFFKNMPDFYIEKAAALVPILEGHNVGFLGEYLSAEEHCIIRPKSPFDGTFGILDRGMGLCFAGRYYGSADPRHQFHALSLRIINSKNYPEKQAECFSKIYSRLILGAVKTGFDYVACVPPRPGQSNRIAKLASKLPETEFFEQNKIGNERINFDLLTCIRDYDSIKGLGTAGRAREVENAFSCSSNVKGKRIVVLDDVHTTGATLNECTRTLTNAGAIDVTQVVLGYHPLHGVQIRDIAASKLRCKCGGEFTTKRFSQKTGEPFYGCSRWAPNTDHDVKDLAVIAKERLKLTEAEFLKLDDELNSGRIDF